MPGKQFDEARLLECEFRIVDAEEKAGVIEGLAAPFDKWNPINSGGHAYMERILPETFATSVSESGHKIPLLMHHEHRQPPIGKALEWRSTSEGLVGVWQMDTAGELGGEAWRLVREGFISGLSVGFQPNPQTDVRDLERAVPHVTRGPGARLYEVSLVTVAAFPEAQILATRTAGLGPVVDPRIEMYRREFEQMEIR